VYIDVEVCTAQGREPVRRCVSDRQCHLSKETHVNVVYVTSRYSKDRGPKTQSRANESRSSTYLVVCVNRDKCGRFCDPHTTENVAAPGGLYKGVWQILGAGLLRYPGTLLYL
jgi:hypothetical protein